MTCWIENVNNNFMLVKIVLGRAVLIKEIADLILALYSVLFGIQLETHLDFNIRKGNKYTGWMPQAATSRKPQQKCPKQ